MSEINNIIEMLKNKSFSFSGEELNKIIEVELKKSEEEQNPELIELCQSLINDQKNTQENNNTKKRKLSFRFISLIATVAVLLFALVPVFLKFITPQNSGTLPQTELSSTLNITETTSVTTTEPTTTPVSDTTNPSTTHVTEVYTNYLCKPEKILFYHNEKPQTLTAEMNREVIKEINSYLRNDYKGGGWKYAAEESMINEIKSHIHIEIYYDSVQTFSTANATDERKYNHLLVSLEGQYKNIIFFGKDGKYMSIPIGPLYSDDFSENILRHIFDE